MVDTPGLHLYDKFLFVNVNHIASIIVELYICMPFTSFPYSLSYSYKCVLHITVNSVNLYVLIIFDVLVIF